MDETLQLAQLYNLNVAEQKGLQQGQLPLTQLDVFQAVWLEATSRTGAASAQTTANEEDRCVAGRQIATD